MPWEFTGSLLSSRRYARVAKKQKLTQPSKKRTHDVIERILNHCDLWQAYPSRRAKSTRELAKLAPPEFKLEPEYIPIDV